MNRIQYLVGFLLFSMIFLSSCAGKETPEPSTMDAVINPGDLLYTDDFLQSSSNWGISGRTGGEIKFEYEGITIRVDYPNFMFWTINGGIYSDSRIEVDAVLLEGPADDNFGVICRFKDSDNFYGFVISHDGYYGIFKMADGTLNLLNTTSDLSYSDVIQQGGVVNHISAICKGDTLSLTVNGTLLEEAKDSLFTKGQNGLLASAYQAGGVKVLFDNYQVFAP